MLLITIEVDAPLGQAIGVKEDLAMRLEHLGSVRVTSITQVGGEQLPITVPPK